MDSELLFPIVVAAAVALLGWGVTLAVVNAVRGEKRKLAERLAGTGGSAGAAAGGGHNPIVLQSEAEGLPPALARLAPMRALHRQLQHAYPEASLVRFLGIAAGCGLGQLLLAWVMTDSALVGAVAGVLGACLPLMVAGARRNKRQKLLAEQLPEALDFLQRILRAGHSLSTGLAMMGEELPQPLGAEFRRCYDQHSLGQPLERAMKDMARRIESTDFAFFVTAVLIQRQTGGDLSQVLGNISGMVRQRTRLQQFVRAKTAEGRFTGYILVAFPVVMFFVAATLNADYKKNLLDDPTGLTLLGVAGALVLLGLFAIRKITTVKV